MVSVDVTNDEAYSFYIMKDFWYVEALCTGNTHWLNSLGIDAAILSGGAFHEGALGSSDARGKMRAYGVALGHSDNYPPECADHSIFLRR